MQFPDEVHRIVKQAARDHPEACAAVDAAVRDVRRLPCYAKLVEDLVHEAVGNLVYSARHHLNREMRRNGGCPPGTGHTRPKVRTTPDAISKVYDRIFDYRVGGVSLGLLRGADLPGIIQGERASADTHTRNAQLLEWVASQGVPEDACVRDVIDPRKLRRTFRRLFGRDTPEQEAA